MSSWIGRRPSYAYSAQSFLRLNETRSDIFVYRFAGDTVELLPKPGVDWGAPHGVHVRAPWYLDLFRMVLAFTGQTFDGLLALSLEDLAEERPDIPLFAFQKPHGSNLILLPDIDTLSFGFYENSYDDTVGYDDKLPTGIFIGATTGMAHTEASVAELKSQRLRSGLFFRDKPEVDFRLPVVCQCLTPEADAAIRALGFGVNPGDWAEQLRHKFLITMDGNGATCSRVVISLKSNSVPVKYVSPHQLYYFDALKPWIHYIPAYSDDDVIDIIKAERNSPDLFRAVAERGQDFYRDFLAKEPTLTYTGQLLASYFACFAEQANPATGSALSALAHLADLGDIAFANSAWIGVPGSGRALEGFQIEPSDGAALTYKVIDIAGGESDWVDPGTFVGQRGASRRLVGFAVRGSGAARYACYGHFAGGQDVGPITDGSYCMSPDGAPLEAIRIEVLAQAAIAEA